MDQSRLIGVTCIKSISQDSTPNIVVMFDSCDKHISLKDLPTDQLDLDTLEPVAPGEIVNIVVEEDEEDDPLE